MPATKSVIARISDRFMERLNDPEKGQVSWYSLVDSALTPTTGLMMGLAEVQPGEGSNKLHRHVEPEIYYVLDGVGEMTIECECTTITAGTAVYIPANAWHGLRNASDVVLRLLYVLPADGIAVVDYQYE